MRERATATLTTVVVDDEALACDELAYLLNDFPEIEVIARGSNGLEAIELIHAGTSMSGGGVGGCTRSDGGMRTPPTSPTYAVPSDSSK